MDRSIIAKIQSYGFDVYMRDETDTYLLFTDAIHIGYLQEDRGGGYSLSTVHKANYTTGTSFGVSQHNTTIDKEALEACFALAPAWAFNRDLHSVVKYKDMAEYLRTDSFKAGFRLVEKV